MKSMDSIKKIDVPSEHWDRLFAPSSCLVMITTVDKEGRINAASYGTCVEGVPRSGVHRFHDGGYQRYLQQCSGNRGICRQRSFL